MSVGTRFVHPREERLQFVKQLGIDDIALHLYEKSHSGHLPVSGTSEWSFQELVQLRNRVEDYGLRLEAIESIPYYFYDEVMLGKDGRDEQLEHVKNTIRNIGRAEIPVLGYSWMPNTVWRTSRSHPLRGGAKGTAFELDQVEDAPLTHDREYTESEMWEYYEYFLREVMPVAEEEGVKLALHPDDPPVAALGGIPRLFRSVDALERAMELVPSDAHGLDCCLGTISEMDRDESVTDVVRRFGEREEIFYVHFRDVEGTVPSFQETFVDEGNYDEVEVMRTLREVGFDGLLIPDHVPGLAGETASWEQIDPEQSTTWEATGGARGRAYAVGYLKGLVNALDDHGEDD